VEGVAADVLRVLPLTGLDEKQRIEAIRR